MNMSAVEVIALAKAIKGAAETAARKELVVPEGQDHKTYEVNAVVNVKGSITVGQDEEFTPTACVPLKESLALFIRYCGITREAAKDALVKAMTDALNKQYRGAATVAEVGDAISDESEVIADCEKQVVAMMEKLPKQKRNGKVTTKLEVTPVNRQSVWDVVAALPR